MYGFEDVTAWFPVAIQPVRYGLYDVVTYEGGPVRQALWGADGWSDGMRTRVDVECWRGLRAGAAASEFERQLSEAIKKIESMKLDYQFLYGKWKVILDERAIALNSLEEAQQKLRDRRDSATLRVQQLQEGALKAIELIGRLYGSTSDSMRADLLDRAVDDIKRSLFPPIE